MRTTLLAGLIALVVPGCIVGGEITGVGGGGGGGGTEEEGGGEGGEGGGGTTATPRITATVDKTTVMTELGKTENLQVTITGADGFSGAVSVTPTLMDGTTPVTATGWTVTSTPASVTLTENGTATALVAVQIPTDAASLMPTLKVDLGGTATAAVSSSFNIAQRVTVDLPAGMGTGIHQAMLPLNQVLRIRPGTQVVFHNSDNTQHVIHAAGGINHENTTSGGMPGSDYMVTPTGDATWYCHNHESGTQTRNINVQ